MTPFRCGTCSHIVAHKASPLQIIVPADAECGQDAEGVWWIRCRCGRVVWWAHDVARQMAKAA